MRDIQYVIQSVNKGNVTYIHVDYENLDIDFVQKPLATTFESRSLANGWLYKAQAMYRTYRFSVVIA